MLASVQHLVSTIKRFKPRVITELSKEQTKDPSTDLNFISNQIQSLLEPRERFLVSTRQYVRDQEIHPTLILFREHAPWRFVFEDTLVLPDGSFKLQRCITVRLSIGVQSPFVIRSRWLFNHILWEELGVIYPDRPHYEDAMEAIESIREDTLALPFDAIACAYEYFEEHSLAT